MFENEKIVETKICKKCDSKFEITDKDLEFYEKISPVFGGKKYLIPSPNLCPDCRQQRRQSFRNERNLYKRKSDLSGKEIISIYSPDESCKVYSQEEWWSDNWNSLDYGKDFDFSKSFFEQFNSLYYAVPKCALHNIRTEGSEYCNNVNDLKNCYLCFATSNAEDSLYGILYGNSTKCLDMYYCISCHNSAYGLDCENLYNSFFVFRCTDSSDLYKCSYCNMCEHCLFCVNLKNKKYHILNEKYSEKEYFELKSKILSDKKIYEEYSKKYEKKLEKSPKKYIYGRNNNNSSGDILLNCNQVKNCYNANVLENSKNVEKSGGGTDSMDVYGLFSYSHLVYECVDVKGHNILFSWNCFNDNKEIYYCINCFSSSNCFGCIGLCNKQYCILNKQYSKEEYEKLVPKIIEKMIENGEWGEFFPGIISPFGYNETITNEFYPLNKEEALIQGFSWSNYEAPLPKVEKIIPANLLPENIKNIPNDILNRAIKCETTGKPFIIQKQELEFYRRHNLPIPRKHPNQRYIEITGLGNPRKLFDRKCDKCEKEIKTTYSPEKPDIVYCEECYNREVY